MAIMLFMPICGAFFGYSAAETQFFGEQADKIFSSTQGAGAGKFGDSLSQIGNPVSQ